MNGSEAVTEIELLRKQVAELMDRVKQLEARPFTLYGQAAAQINPQYYAGLQQSGRLT